MTDPRPVLPPEAPSRTVKDSLGRALLVRELDALEELDLIEAAGALADNSRWLSNVRVCCAVREIDGVPVAFPKVKEHCRQAVRRIGRAGMEAAIQALYPAAGTDADEGAADPAAEGAATAKN